MTEIFSTEVPKTIEGLHDILGKLDKMKQLRELYQNCDIYYENEILPNNTDDDFTDIINPKKRKNNKNKITLSFH